MLARYENPETKVQVRKPKDGGPIVTMYPHKVATDAANILRTALAEPDDTALLRQALAALQGYASSIQLGKNQIEGEKAIHALNKRLETRHDRSNSNQV